MIHSLPAVLRVRLEQAWYPSPPGGQWMRSTAGTSNSRPITDLA